MFEIKRVYEKPDKNDGTRVLIDHLWPRGLTKEEVDVEYWMKGISPSNTLRKWFAHKEERWQEFKNRYLEELKAKEKNELLEQLIDLGKNKKVTLLYAAKDEERNNAQVLLEILKNR